MKETPEKLQWHPAFYAATELELRENLDDLEFEPEHNLSKAPLQMDLLIIKKRRDVELKNEIGHLMRKHNIIEYKGPGDILTIDTLYKVLGYASLYKAHGLQVNSILATDITISIFRWAYPHKLMQQLAAANYIIEQKFPGIYYILGNEKQFLLFPIQIIVMKQLVQKNHSCFRILTQKADIEDVRTFLTESELLMQKRERNNIDAVLQVSVRANELIYEEVRREQHMCEALRELMKEEFEEERNKAITEGLEQGRAQGIAQGRADSIVDSIRNISESLGLSAEEAMDALKIPESERDNYISKL